MSSFLLVRIPLVSKAQEMSEGSYKLAKYELALYLIWVWLERKLYQATHIQYSARSYLASLYGIRKHKRPGRFLTRKDPRALPTGEAALDLRQRSQYFLAGHTLGSITTYGLVKAAISVLLCSPPFSPDHWGFSLSLLVFLLWTLSKFTVDTRTNGWPNHDHV